MEGEADVDVEVELELDVVPSEPPPPQATSPRARKRAIANAEKAKKRSFLDRGVRCPVARVPVVVEAVCAAFGVTTVISAREYCSVIEKFRYAWKLTVAV
jgi:hypothetical protein